MSSPDRSHFCLTGCRAALSAYVSLKPPQIDWREDVITASFRCLAGTGLSRPPDSSGNSQTDSLRTSACSLSHRPACHSEIR